MNINQFVNCCSNVRSNGVEKLGIHALDVREDDLEGREGHDLSESAANAGPALVLHAPLVVRAVPILILENIFKNRACRRLVRPTSEVRHLHVKGFQHPALLAHLGQLHHIQHRKAR
jgi:hypothetical protein